MTTESDDRGAAAVSPWARLAALLFYKASEPTTWLGLGGMIAAAGFNVDESNWQFYAAIGSGVCGAVAVALHEKGGPPKGPPKGPPAVKLLLIAVALAAAAPALAACAPGASPASVMREADQPRERFAVAALAYADAVAVAESLSRSNVLSLPMLERINTARAIARAALDAAGRILADDTRSPAEAAAWIEAAAAATRDMLLIVRDAQRGKPT